MSTINTKHAQQIGVELTITGTDYAIPDGWSLPAELSLRSAHVRNRGAYIGRSWYLQSWGRTSGTEVDLIHFGPELEQLEQVRGFLAHHGYRCVDEYCGLYRRS